MTKTIQDNDVTDRRGLVYVEKDTKLSRPIRLGVVYGETRQNNNVTDVPHAVYADNKIELL